MILTSIKIIKITFHECDEPFALGARNDYLLKETGPYIFKMLSVGAAAKWLYMMLYAKPGVQAEWGQGRLHGDGGGSCGDCWAG